MSTTSRETQVRTNADPTQTTTVRKGWVREFNSRWRRVRGAVRSRLRSDGARLLNERDQALAVSEMRRYLRQTMREHVVVAADPRSVRAGQHWTSSRVRDAYRTGLRNAGRRLKAAGVPEATVERVTEPGHARHREELRGEYLAAYADIEDVVAAVRKEATRAFREQVRQSAAISPTIQAVNDRLDATGQTRTQAVANTRTTEAANAAAITAYELAGVTEVSALPETQPRETTTNFAGCCSGHEARERIRTNQEGAGKVEFVTAGDSRVCPECSALAGITFTIEQVKQNQDALHPPIHPSCRCYLLPMTVEVDGETVEAGPIR